MLHELSIVVICYNEENNLPRLLDSLPSNIELIVVDSFSTDNTVKVAESYGGKVFQRKFDNFGSQKNYAISKATSKWILCLDADEELTARLKESIKSVTNKSTTTYKAYSLSRKLVFLSRMMKYGKTSDNPVRLFLNGSAKYEGAIHEKLDVSGPINRKLKGDLLHYSYNDISDYFSRFNRYTSEIAKDRAAKNKKPSFISHIFRPWFEFFSRYFLRLGFLDGYPGYTYALFSSLYTYTKYAKFYELTGED